MGKELNTSKKIFGFVFAGLFLVALTGNNVISAKSQLFTPPFQSSQTVAVDDMAFSYTGTWHRDGSCTGAYNNTCNNTTYSGTYATYTFTGSTMTIFARTAYNRGMMDVYLDDNFLSRVDLYSSITMEQKAVYSTSFPYGQHTVKLAWTGTKNTASTST